MQPNHGAVNQMTESNCWCGPMIGLHESFLPQEYGTGERFFVEISMVSEDHLRFRCVPHHGDAELLFEVESLLHFVIRNESISFDVVPDEAVDISRFWVSRDSALIAKLRSVSRGIYADVDLVHTVVIGSESVVEFVSIGEMKQVDADDDGSPG